MKEAVTKVIYSVIQEDFHGALQKFLERYKWISAGGDYFEGNKSFMCVLSIKVPLRNKSGNLFNDPHIPSLPLLPGPLWQGAVAPDRVLSMGQIELNCELMLNWIVRNRTVFDIETLLIPNWIVWNRTIFSSNCVWIKKTILTLKWNLFELELFD